MRKILFTLVLLLSVGIVANAQFKFGVKAAANFATTNGDGDDMKVGFSGGLLGQYKFNDRWAIQPEVLFNMQGPKGETGNGTLKLNLGYIAVPVMAQFYIINGLFVEAGPQIGFLVTAKAKIDGESEDVKDGFKTVEAAINYGVGYELQNVPVGFFFRSSIGVTSMAKKSYGFDEDLRNISFQLGAFVKF
ncbi:MAG: PorT family protein [Prevotellaceae bacterium]|jgi:hypothetical protein|nr:PorT family protein [Prevotellaceae bacterium]